MQMDSNANLTGRTSQQQQQHRSSTTPASHDSHRQHLPSYGAPLHPSLQAHNHNHHQRPQLESSSVLPPGYFPQAQFGVHPPTSHPSRSSFQHQYPSSSQTSPTSQLQFQQPFSSPSHPPHPVPQSQPQFHPNHYAQQYSPPAFGNLYGASQMQSSTPNSHPAPHQYHAAVNSMPEMARHWPQTKGVPFGYGRHATAPSYPQADPTVLRQQTVYSQGMQNMNNSRSHSSSPSASPLPPPFADVQHHGSPQAWRQQRQHQHQKHSPVSSSANEDFGDFEAAMADVWGEVNDDDPFAAVAPALSNAEIKIESPKKSQNATPEPIVQEPISGDIGKEHPIDADDVVEHGFKPNIYVDVDAANIVDDGDFGDFESASSGAVPPLLDVTLSASTQTTILQTPKLQLSLNEMISSNFVGAFSPTRDSSTSVASQGPDSENEDDFADFVGADAQSPDKEKWNAFGDDALLEDDDDFGDFESSAWSDKDKLEDGDGVFKSEQLAVPSGDEGCEDSHDDDDSSFGGYRVEIEQTVESNRISYEHSDINFDFPELVSTQKLSEDPITRIFERLISEERWAEALECQNLAQSLSKGGIDETSRQQWEASPDPTHMSYSCMVATARDLGSDEIVDTFRERFPISPAEVAKTDIRAAIKEQQSAREFLIELVGPVPGDLPKITNIWLEMIQAIATELRQAHKVVVHFRDALESLPLPEQPEAIEILQGPVLRQYLEGVRAMNDVANRMRRTVESSRVFPAEGACITDLQIVSDLEQTMLADIPKDDPNFEYIRSMWKESTDDGRIDDAEYPVALHSHRCGVCFVSGSGDDLLEHEGIFLHTSCGNLYTATCRQPFRKLQW